jgi:phosphoglycolate phosphatase
MPRLLLFDIDGTLIRTGGAGVRGMTRAFEAVFGVRRAFEGIAMAGRIDPQIIADALARAGIQATGDGLASFRSAYSRLLLEELQAPMAAGGRVMPGVGRLLEALHGRRGTFVALLTGNYSEAARIKLDHFGLWDYFRCGAFGEDASQRSELVAVALARVRTHGLTEDTPRDVFVVGDTPLDVACARAAGVRSIAVATGGSSVDLLRASGADEVFRDLTDTDAFLRVVEDGANRMSVFDS